MPDELTVVSEEIKQKIRIAGANKLDQMQLATALGLSDHDCRMLMLKHPELSAEYRAGETQVAMECLETLKWIAKDPEHKQQFVAAKYLYELFSGRQSSNITVNMNSYKDNNQKLVEILDAETIEQIAND